MAFGSADSVSVELYNKGNQPLDFALEEVVLTATLNGSIVLRDTLQTGSLAMGETLLYTFGGTINLAGSPVHAFELRVDMAGDVDASNDFLQEFLWELTTIGSFPYSEDFGGGPSGWVFDVINSSWELGTPAGTVIASLPPNAMDMNSWMTGLANPYQNDEMSWVVSPFFDMTSLNTPLIGFDIWWECESGIDWAVLQSSTDGGITWQAVESTPNLNNLYTTGSPSNMPAGVVAGWTGSSGGWTHITQLGAELGGEPSVLFRIGFWSNPSIVSDGIAFDNVVIEDAGSGSIEALGFVPYPPTECGGVNTAVKMEVVNLGAASISDFEAGFVVEGGDTIFENFQLTIAAGDTVEIEFAEGADFSNGRSHSLTAFVHLQDDINLQNDTIETTLLFPETVQNLPYLQDFETGGVLDSLWVQGEDQAVDWYIGILPYYVPDHTTGSGYYMYTDDDTYADSIDLYSACIDLRGLAPASLSFWVYSTNFYTINQNPGNQLVVSAIAGDEAIDLDTISHMNNNQAWVNRILQLDSIQQSDIFRIRFRGQTTWASAASHDIGLDDVGIQFDKDLGIVGFSESTSQRCFSTTEEIAINIVNLGVEPIDFSEDSVYIDMTITGPINQVIRETLSMGVLAVGDTLEVFFGDVVNLFANGTYSFHFALTLADDGVEQNDTLSLSLMNQDVRQFPYFEDFSGGVTAWEAGGVHSSWALGTPTGGDIRVIGTTGIDSWVTNLQGNYSNNEYGWVMSPCLDFSNLISPEIEMDVWWHTFYGGEDGAALQYSLDGGENWHAVGTFEDAYNWYNAEDVEAVGGAAWSGITNQWTRVRHSLSGLGEESAVLLRVLFASDSTGVWDGFAFDNVRIQEASPNNLELIDIELGNDAVCLYDSVGVSLRVWNVGANTIHSFSAGYSNDGTQQTTESFSLVLAPGDTGVVDFMTKAYVEGGGDFELLAYTLASGDTATYNDTTHTSFSIIPTLSNFPYKEDFEDGGMLDSLWYQGENQEQDWLVWTGGTPNFGTGPLEDHTSGNGYYMYMEDSGEDHYPIDLYTSCFTIDTFGTALASIWYHSHNIYGNVGLGDNVLYLELGRNGGWISLDSIGHSVNDWEYWDYDLSPYAENGKPFQLRFRGSTDNGLHTHDIAIDDFELGYQTDISWVGFEDFESRSCLGMGETISVRITNTGLETFDFGATPATILVEVDGGTQVLTNILDNDTLGVGEERIIGLDSTLSFASIAQYTIVGQVLIQEDGNPLNNSSQIVVEAGFVDSFPYEEDFAGGAGGWKAEGNASTWGLGTPNGTVIQGAYSDTNAWMTGLNGGYANSESSGVSSPCLDFSTLVNPEILMQVWWDMETSYDGAVLQSSVDGGMSWQVVGSFEDGGNWYTDDAINGLPGGQASGWTGSGNDGSGGWVLAQHALDGLGGEAEVKLRIAFGADVSNNAFDGFAFDNVIIREESDVDLAALGFVTPADSICGATDIRLGLLIANLGEDNVNEYVIAYSIDGGQYIRDTLVSLIGVGDTIAVMFETEADLSSAGIHNLLGFVSVGGDLANENDTTLFTITSLLSIDSYPYMEDFSTGAGGWRVEGTNASWELGTPMGTNIQGAASDANSWMTGLNTPYQANERSWVVSPCFDFSAMNSPLLSMSVWWDCEAGWDGAVLESSVDGGQTWERVGAYGDSVNWYNRGFVLNLPESAGAGWSGQGSNSSQGWVTAQHSLDGLGGESSVLLRIAFGSDGSNHFDGFAFDDISILDPLDLALVEILSPVSEICEEGDVIVQLKVANVGGTTIPSFTCGYSINAGTTVTQPINFPLSPGDTGIISLQVLADLSGSSTYSFVGFVETLGDNLQENDSIRFDIELARDVFEPNDASSVALPSVGTNGNASICDLADIDRFHIYVNADEPNIRVSLTGTEDSLRVRLLDGLGTMLMEGTNAEGELVLVSNAIGAGMYEVEVSGEELAEGSDGYNLRVQHSDQPFEIRTDIDIALLEEQIQLYPNPSEGKVFVRAAFANRARVAVKVIDAYGRTIWNEEAREVVGEERWELDLTHVAAGMYWVEVIVDGQLIVRPMHIR